MAVGGRSSRFTAKAWKELWERWSAGESISDISRALNAPTGSVFTVLRSRGGIAPPERKTRDRSLTLYEREMISRGIAAGKSIRDIAQVLHRAPSTISREITRNQGREKYCAVFADKRAEGKSLRPKLCKLAGNPRLRDIIANKLQLCWSPQQIAGYLKRMFPDDPGMQCSHETIYVSLYVQARGVLKKELQAYLRTHRPIRRGKNHSQKGKPRNLIPGMITISKRPPEVADRAIPGHWEGDLVLGSNNTRIATIVERSTRYCVLIQLDAHDMHTVAHRISTQMSKIPDKLRKTLTWDRGMELAKHQEITNNTGLKVYFCDPYSPWQRGSNENTNGLLRQYFPKKTPINYNQQELDQIADQLNNRPRATLNFHTPQKKLHNLLP